MQTVRLDASDNVVTATRPIEVGVKVETAVTIDLIPSGHKIATAPIPLGAPVRKYSQVIGYASCDIDVGAHVHKQTMNFPLICGR